MIETPVQAYCLFKYSHTVGALIMRHSKNDYLCDVTQE